MRGYCENMPEFYSWSEPVARKAHRCCECDALIVKGEKHFSCTGKWEGGISTFRQHTLCMEACMYVRDKLNDGDCVGFGSLREWISDCDFHRYRKLSDWQPLRKMLACIKRRERRK